MGREINTYRGEERRIEDFGGKPEGKTTWKTLA
jgi:hypothetical protein